MIIKYLQDGAEATIEENGKDVHIPIKEITSSITVNDEDKNPRLTLGRVNSLLNQLQGKLEDTIDYVSSRMDERKHEIHLFLMGSVRMYHNEDENTVEAILNVGIAAVPEPVDEVVEEDTPAEEVEVAE